ncbi:MAG: SRPBCC family protein [Granulosicoccaceae bacterium]
MYATHSLRFTHSAIAATAITFLYLLLSSTSVQAHGPTRQKVTETIEIDATAEAVWEVIQNFGDANWLPMVELSSADKENEVGSVRTLTLAGGAQVIETLKTYKADKMMYKYRISDATHDVTVLPVNNYSSTLSVKASGDKAIVTWKGAFYRGYPNNDPPEELSDEAAVNAVTGLYQAGLAGLKELVENKS